MKKTQKIQKIISIIPFYSSIIVFFITMFVLKRNKASWKMWFRFALLFFLSGSAVYFLNTILMTRQHPILNFIASGSLLAVTNLMCVNLQIQCIGDNASGVASNNNPRTIGYIAPVLVLIGIAISIGVVTIITMFTSPSVDIADSNGIDDYNLTVISLDEIKTTTNHYSAKLVGYSSSGSKSDVDGSLREYDFDVCSFSSKKISGIKTLQVTKSDCEKMSLHVESTITTGNAEIVVLIDGEYYDHIALNQVVHIELDNIEGKTIVVRLAAESAEIDISVSRQFIQTA